MYFCIIGLLSFNGGIAGLLFSFVSERFSMPNSSDINVNSFGIGTHHPIGFMRNRKRCGDYLFLHFLTPYRIHLRERVHVRSAGECLIFTPNSRQHYGSDGITAFGNDWMHISGSGVQPLLKRMELPLNTPMVPGSSAFVPKLLREIGLEISERRPNWEFGVDVRVRNFFLELSRAVNGDEKNRLAPKNEEMHERLNRLRLDIQARCAEKWDLERMLAQVHMSRSKFTIFYRKIFNISPIDDVINMRLTLAKQYLETTEFSVTHIAEVCGFSDVYYFCRLFKAKNGISPGKYRSDTPASTTAVTGQIWKDGKKLSHQRRYSVLKND